MLSYLTRGEFDDKIDVIADAVRVRKSLTKQSQAMELRSQLQVGDKVRVTHGRPRYMVGATGVVTKIMVQYVMIDLDEPCGRFYRNIRCPLSMLEKVETGK